MASRAASRASIEPFERRLLMSSAGDRAPSFIAMRVNAGGGYVVDSLGRAFAPDAGFTGGQVAQAAYDVLNTTDDAVFTSYRTGTQFSFSQSVPNGNYALFLEFAEATAGAAAGQRTFDVTAEGVQVADDYDVVAAAGAAQTAVVKEADVHVADGAINLEFHGVVGG